tara:strand:+ start:293 stop:694 length:402 start_codon:yes stop_codon:yes gene_type:complete
MISKNQHDFAYISAHFLLKNLLINNSLFLIIRTNFMLSTFFIATFSALILEGEPKTTTSVSQPSIIIKGPSLSKNNKAEVTFNKLRLSKNTDVTVMKLDKVSSQPKNKNPGISGWSKDKEAEDFKNGNPDWVK